STVKSFVEEWVTGLDTIRQSMGLTSRLFPGESMADKARSLGRDELISKEKMYKSFVDSNREAMKNASGTEKKRLADLLLMQNQMLLALQAEIEARKELEDFHFKGGDRQKGRFSEEFMNAVS